MGKKRCQSYQEVRALKGVGDYTAAAICSIAYNMPYAVVDGNVYRVLSRYCGIDVPIDSTEGKKLFAALADEMLDKSRPATYNQAIMDFGAIQCTPQSPNCMFCPLADSCSALSKGQVMQLPVKQHRTKTSNRYFNYIYVRMGACTFIHKRTADDIWKKIVIALDSFKGCLTSAEAGEAAAQGVHAACPECRTIVLPVADGGEGMLDVLLAASNGKRITVRAHDPLMQPCDASYGISGDGNTAFVEMAAISGLYLAQGEYFLQQLRLEDAQLAFQKALQYAYYSEGETLEIIGIAYLRSNYILEALDSFLELERQFPEIMQRNYYFMAYCYFLLQQPQETFTYLVRGTVYCPEVLDENERVFVEQTMPDPEFFTLANDIARQIQSGELFPFPVPAACLPVKCCQCSA